MTGWTDERVELLKRFWNEGKSASECATSLGGGITRNSVVAKVHRLRQAGAELRAKPATTVRRAAAPKPPRPMSPKPVRAPTPEPAKDEAPFVEPVDPTAFAPLPEADRAVHFCLWPIGDPLSDSFGFCGREQGRLSPTRRDPYCADHRAAERRRAPKTKTSANELARALRKFL